MEEDWNAEVEGSAMRLRGRLSKGIGMEGRRGGVYMYVCMYVCMCVCVCICVRIWVRICVCTSVPGLTQFVHSNLAVSSTSAYPVHPCVLISLYTSLCPNASQIHPPHSPQSLIRLMRHFLIFSEEPRQVNLHILIHQKRHHRCWHNPERIRHHALIKG